MSPKHPKTNRNPGTAGEGAGESRFACTIALAYPSSQIREGGDRAIIARAHHRSRVSLPAYLGGGGLGNYGSRATQLACIIARILGGRRTGETKLACIIARAHHCPHFMEGEDRAIIDRAHHRSRVSLPANLGGGELGNCGSRASQLASIIARILGGRRAGQS